ncbi:hypothetical protein RB195_025483 [Necator americanus]|uniref:Reverse transcriptase domain-containing protein n=1 Tax=Necator americanus TaxID=51031 RepID=A0ABR1ESH7_NECAM
MSVYERVRVQGLTALDGSAGVTMFARDGRGCLPDSDSLVIRYNVMSLPSPAKRRCASVRPTSNSSQKCAPENMKTPARCSTASPLIPTNATVSDGYYISNRQRSPESPLKVLRDTHANITTPNEKSPDSGGKPGTPGRMGLQESCRKIKYDVIGLTETRRRHHLNAVQETGEELFLGTCDSRGVGGVGVLVNTSMAKNIDSFEQLLTRIGRLRMRRCGPTPALTIFVAYTPTNQATKEKKSTLSIWTWRSSTEKIIPLTREAIKEDLQKRRVEVLAEAAEAGKSIRCVHIHIVSKLIKVSREYNMPLCRTFINLKKAFDSVETEPAMETLDNRCVPTHYIRVLRELYSNFTTGILPLYKNIIIDVKRGVRQGDTISPKIFTTTLENAMRKLEWDDMGVKVDGRQLHHLRFADDIVLVTPSISQAERMLTEFDETCGCIGLQLNLQKTMFIRNGWVSDAPFTLNRTNIFECTSHVYLGRELSMMNDLTPEPGRRRHAAWGAYKSVDVVRKIRSTSGSVLAPSTPPYFLL